MSKVQILDCTLRDGGYCNEWKFGRNNIPKVLMGLEEAGIDIIECGFLKDSSITDDDSTQYSSLQQAEKFISTENKNCQYVCMINYGAVDIANIPDYSGGIISGIRVAFHKKDLKPALEFCEQIKKKGYLVYLQPMVVLDYSDEEFLELVRLANLIHPYAFYIVDSFGVMKKKELIHIFYMADKNLKTDIMIGFHSHNNMQLSYSNAQSLLEIQGNRDVIIDCCVFGMGRGAGNLNTELFEQYVNDNYGGHYSVPPILRIYDEILARFYVENSWGYSLANYLSAAHNSHPNYATYLENKNTLTVPNMNHIFSMMDVEKKNQFDKEYIEKLYQEYMARNRAKEEDSELFRKQVHNREVLIVASGTSSREEKDIILEYIKKNNCLVIAINAEYPYYESDYVFVSNIRRYKQMDKKLYPKMIVTSNILCDEAHLRLDYDKYTNNYEGVEDNAALLLIRFLIQEGISQIAIAGIDGYSHDLTQNYADSKMLIVTSSEVLDRRNVGIERFINEQKEFANIHSVTKPRYIRF